MKVRLERSADRHASVEIERAAFGSQVEAAIVIAVRDEEGSFAFVAEEEGTVVGHVQLSRAWVGKRPVVALGPIAVLPELQGRGIGRALIEAAAAQARVREETALILLGSQAYYARLGFEAASRYGLRNPFAGVPEDGFVIAEEDFQIPPLHDRVHELTGKVRWQAAFG